MHVLTSTSSLMLWQDVIKQAENRCSISLKQELEAYLVSLLVRYTNRPDIIRQIVATAFLNAIQEESRQHSLQCIGDQCLLFTGLFPQITKRRQVKIKYYVDLGRSAYAAISSTTNDLYGSLAFEFVALMDVLQSIREYSELLPLDAYEQWHEVGSQRALQVLQTFTKKIPLKI